MQLWKPCEFVPTTAIVLTIDNRFSIDGLSKINDTRALGKSLPEKLTAKVTEKCDPAVNDHTLDDMRGEGAPGVAQQIETKDVEVWCKHFGGDGDIGSFAEWLSCIQSAHVCQARQAIATQFPRAPEWLTDVYTAMGLLPVDPDDPTAISDAQVGVSGANGEIDGDGDNIVDLRCGGLGTTCSTACCYIENIPPNSPETSCIEYTGSVGNLGAFMALCGFTSSIPAAGGPGSQVHVAVPGPCGAGPSPVNGNPCIFGVNLMFAPTDSICP